MVLNPEHEKPQEAAIDSVQKEYQKLIDLKKEFEENRTKLGFGQKAREELDQKEKKKVKKEYKNLEIKIRDQINTVWQMRQQLSFSDQDNLTLFFDRLRELEKEFNEIIRDDEGSGAIRLYERHEGREPKVRRVSQ